MKKILIPALLLLSFQPFAQSEGAFNFYAGVSLGQAEFDVDRSELDLENGTLDSLDDSDSSFKIFGGYKFNDYLSVELGYANLGELSFKNTIEYSLPVIPPESNTITIDSSAEVSGVILNGILSYPISDTFSAFLKAGAFVWETDDVSSIRSVNSRQGVTYYTKESDSGDGTDLFCGIGVSYTFSKFQVRLDLAQFENDGDNINNISLSGIYQF